MRKKILALTLTSMAISGYAIAQTPKPDSSHSAHHPAGIGPGGPSSAYRMTSSPEAYEQQMKAMQEMHQKMQAAKTPAERAALMDEHMKTMRSGMGMMRQMGPNRQPMENRMEMMEQMMQMMMDRLPPAK